MAILSGISNTITAIVAGVTVVACVGLSGALWWQGRAVAGLKADNARLQRVSATLTAQVEQARLSRDVAAAHAKQAAQISAARAAAIEAIRNLQLGECADAPLDPVLRDLLGRL